MSSSERRRSSGARARKKRLDAVYERYGYKVLELQHDTVRVYARRAGTFLLAEIVPLASGAPAERAAAELEASGYVTRIQRHRRDAVASSFLFAAHFEVLASRQRLEQQIRGFKSRIATYLGSPYSYIPAPFEVASVESESLVSGTVVDVVQDIFSRSGTHLVFLEAAAGFGKTCTAFEVLEALLSAREDWLPILTELQYNRKAKLFRYVLLDEIDKQFNLPSRLVADEIQSGRLPLIVDGFDELLLQKPQGDEVAVDFTDAEAMLDTISSLLSDQAKVLITTRRTALFSGAEFEDWLDRLHLRGCKVHRVELGLPRIVDWLGGKKKERLERSGVPLVHLSNPVLLSYLRELEEEEFREICRDASRVVEHYFRAMLKREKKRQDLRMDPDEQLGLLRCIAGRMLTEDTVYITLDGIREAVFHDARALAILDDCAALYHGGDAVNREDLISKLLVHALLDRAAAQHKVCFINDFVLGTLQGDLVKSTVAWAGSNGQVDRVTTAYSAQSHGKREGLWEALELVREAGDPAVRMLCDLRLRNRIVGSYHSATVESIRFDGIQLGRDNSFTESTFVRCVFQRCTIDGSNLLKTGFVDCEFYSCKVVNIDDGSMWQRGGTFSDTIDFSKPTLAEVCALNGDEVEDTPATLRRVILEQFWPPGRANYTKRKRRSTLFKGRPGSEHRDLLRAVDSLVLDGWLTKLRDRSYLLNTEEYQEEIRDALGLVSAGE